MFPFFAVTGLSCPRCTRNKGKQGRADSRAPQRRRGGSTRRSDRGLRRRSTRPRSTATQQQTTPGGPPSAHCRHTAPGPPLPRPPPCCVDFQRFTSAKYKIGYRKGVARTVSGRWLRVLRGEDRGLAEVITHDLQHTRNSGRRSRACRHAAATAAWQAMLPSTGSLVSCLRVEGALVPNGCWSLLKLPSRLPAKYQLFCFHSQLVLLATVWLRQACWLACAPCAKPADALYTASNFNPGLPNLRRPLQTTLACSGIEVQDDVGTDGMSRHVSALPWLPALPMADPRAHCIHMHCTEGCKA